MGLKTLIVLALCSALFSYVEAQFMLPIATMNIKNPIVITAGPDSTGKFLAIAPVNQLITVTCNVTFQDTTCSNQSIGFSRSGLELNVKKFCNSTTVTLTSIGNEMLLVYVLKVPGNIVCEIKTVNQTNANCDCGWGASNKRIVGGTETLVNEFASHAGIIDTTDRTVICGAIIIQQYWAITAAHCTVYPVSKTALLVGDHNIKTGTETPYAALYRIESFTRHPSYSELIGLNDIALVRTKAYIKYNVGVGPACLPYKFNRDNFVGKIVTAVGWGNDDFGGRPSDVLKKVDLNVVASRSCKAPLQFCTYAYLKDACLHDNGGGLYYYSSKKFIIGIISEGIGCATNNPGVNTNVTEYIGWIEKTTGGFFCKIP